MIPPERFETERLILRKPHMDDASVLHLAYMQDPNVTLYTTWRPHRHLQETKDFIKNCIVAWENETRFPSVITLKEKDDPFGMIDFHINWLHSRTWICDCLFSSMQRIRN